MVTPHLVNAVVRDNALVTRHVQLVIDTHRTAIRSAAVKGQKVVLTDFGSFEVASRRKGTWGNSGSNTSTAQSAWRTYPSLARLALARVGLDALPRVLATVTYAPHRSS